MKRLLIGVAAAAICASCTAVKPLGTSQYEKLQEQINTAFFAKEYTKADRLLEKSLAKYPDREGADARLMQWASVKKRLGQTQEAREILMKLICDYPKSELVPLAKQDLDNLESR